MLYANTLRAKVKVKLEQLENTCRQRNKMQTFPQKDECRHCSSVLFVLVWEEKKLKYLRLTRLKLSNHTSCQPLMTRNGQTLQHCLCMYAELRHLSVLKVPVLLVTMHVVKYFHHGLCPNLSRVLSSVRRMMCSAAATLNLWRADSQRESASAGLECSDRTHQTLVSYR